MSIPKDNPLETSLELTAQIEELVARSKQLREQADQLTKKAEELQKQQTDLASAPNIPRADNSNSDTTL